MTGQDRSGEVEGGHSHFHVPLIVLDSQFYMPSIVQDSQFYMPYWREKFSGTIKDPIMTTNKAEGSHKKKCHKLWKKSIIF